MRVIMLPQVDSTNSEVLRRIESGAHLPLVVLATTQHAGRGRAETQWVSTVAGNLYFSMGLELSPASGSSLLSLSVGRVVLRVLEEAGLRGGWLKWPNDVMVEGCKLGGILIEACQVAGANRRVCVVGIGINLVAVPVAESVCLQALGLCLTAGELAERLVYYHNQWFEPLSHDDLRHAFSKQLWIKRGEDQEIYVSDIQTNGNLTLTSLRNPTAEMVVLGSAKHPFVHSRTLPPSLNQAVMRRAQHYVDCRVRSGDRSSPILFHEN